MVGKNKNGAEKRKVDRRFTNPFWMVGCRVTAKSESGTHLRLRP